MGLTVELRQPFQHHRAGRHVDPECKRLGREHGLDQAADEQFFDRLLEYRDEPGVMGRDAAAQAFAPLPVLQHLEILARHGRGALVDDGVDLGALAVVGEPQPGVHTLLHGRIAPGPAEHEGDRRQQAVAVQARDDVGTRLRSPVAQPARAAAPVVRAGIEVAHPLLHVAGQFAVDAGAVAGEQVEEPAADEHVLPQRHGPLLVHDHLGLAADRHEPLAELLGIGDGRAAG